MLGSQNIKTAHLKPTFLVLILKLTKNILLLTIIVVVVLLLLLLF